MLQIAPLPPNLQEHLASFIDKEKAGRDDMVSILSQAHLQSLHSRFLSGHRDKDWSRENAKHPTWSKIEIKIRETSDANNLPMSPAGLSFTINDYIRQYATAIANMWTGSIYHKSLDYLLRILLRLHLAPKREARFKDQVKAILERKQKQSQAKSSTESRRLWQWKVTRLCDRMAEALQKNRPSKVIQSIVERLSIMLEEEPEARDGGGFFSLEKQLDALNIDETVEDDLSIIDPEEDLDDVDDLEEDDVDDLDDAATGTTGKGKGKETKIEEPSRGRLRSLQAVLKTLLESPFIEKDVDSNWVRKTGHVNNDFTDFECKVVATLANLLRPYVPKRRSALQGSVPHVALRAPLVLIANAVLRATGYHKFTRLTSLPHLSMVFF